MVWLEFYGDGGLLIINAILLFPIKFPNPQAVQQSVEQNTNTRNTFNAAKVVTTILFAIYGYLSMALMIWYTQWITLFGQKSSGYSVIQSHLLLSLYSIGSIIGVLLLFILLGRNASETKIMIVMNSIATLSILALILTRNIWIAEICSFLFGFSAASGVMQTALTAFMRLYANRRGLVTGVFYFFGAIASFTVPIITGCLSKISIASAFSSDAIIGIIAIVVSVLIKLLEKVNQEK